MNAWAECVFQSSLQKQMCHERNVFEIDNSCFYDENEPSNSTMSNSDNKKGEKVQIQLFF